MHDRDDIVFMARWQFLPAPKDKEFCLMRAHKDSPVTKVMANPVQRERASAVRQGRRRMIRGATAVVPTILTLHSGAALARTSNLISRAPGAPVDSAGNNMCLNEASVAEVMEGGQRYDLGDPVAAEVTNIPTTDGRIFYENPDLSGSPLSGQEMCEKGGTFYYEAAGASPADLGAEARADLIRQSFIPEAVDLEAKAAAGVEVPRGGLVSATALASFAGKIVYRSI